MTSLDMKRVLVTGAARGLGLAMARRFAAAGAQLVLTDLDEAQLEVARRELEASGARCRAYRLDVTDEAAIAAVRERLHDEAGQVDVLVNNAGVVFGGPFLDVPLARHRATLRVNVEGTVAMTHAFLPDLLASPGGHLVTIASASGFIGMPNGATYAASKWAAIGFAESIRAELRHTGRRDVGVTIVCPTYIATGMFAGAEPPKTARILDPDELAGKIVEAVRRGKVWVLEPWIVKITPLLKASLPQPLSDVVSEAFGATSGMDRWRGHGGEQGGEQADEQGGER